MASHTPAFSQRWLCWTFLGLRPRFPAGIGSGKAYNWASRRNREMRVAWCPRHVQARRTQAELPSPSSIHCRAPNQRETTLTIWIVQSIVVL
jgi:hypothetical protein